MNLAREDKSEITEEKLLYHIFLDHLRNRELVRITEYRHPYVRLCPVSRETNTEGGADIGIEGLEKENIRKLADFPDHIRIPMEQALAAPIILADPFDLTKMLDIPPIHRLMKPKEHCKFSDRDYIEKLFSRYN